MQHFNLMTRDEAATMVPEYDVGTFLPYGPQIGDPPYSSTTVHGHTFGPRFGITHIYV